MRLKEGSKSRDVLIGKRGFIDREAGVQIVDWRNAPISRVYYRYDEGDDYDEEVGGNPLEGIVEIRRNISIQHSLLRRIGAPQATFVRDSDKIWHQASESAVPVLQGGSGKAVRVPKAPIHHNRGKGGKKDRARLGVQHGPGTGPDKHLPEIAALIDLSLIHI